MRITLFRPINMVSSPGKLTQQTIFDVSKFIYSGLNHKKPIGIVSLDVAKAFDCINHDILYISYQKFLKMV